MNWCAAPRLAALVGLAFFLRCTALSQTASENLAYVSEQKGGILAVDVDTLKVVRSAQSGEGARGLAVTPDGKFVVTAIAAAGDISVYAAEDLRFIRRVQVGDNPEFVRIHPNGKWCFVSTEVHQQAADAGSKENDAAKSQIVMLNILDWTLERTFSAGTETEGIEFSQDGKSLIVANEGQDSLAVFDIASGKAIREVDLARYGSRPRGIKVSPNGNKYAVTMELSGTLLLLDRDFRLIRSAPTGAMPDGVSFDRQGKTIVVAASGARKIQFFSAESLSLIAEAPAGQRCWHFTFTPDDSKLLVACGRSGNIYAIDPRTYRIIRTLDGFQMPWGIATYPHAYGSLDLP